MQIVLLASLAGCSSSLVALNFSTPGQKEAVVRLDSSRDVKFWTDFDATFEGQLAARFGVELLQDGRLVGATSCDPLLLGQSRLCVTRYNVGHRRHYNCRMDCSLSVPKTAPTLVRVSFGMAAARTPRLDRAEIRVEQ